MGHKIEDEIKEQEAVIFKLKKFSSRTQDLVFKSIAESEINGLERSIKGLKLMLEMAEFQSGSGGVLS